MSDQIYSRPPTSAELSSIEETRRAYRAMWAKLKNVPPRAFDGSRDDLDALDFIDYEAGHHPQGLVGAAIIWGGVLAATGLVTWAFADEQLVLVGDPDYPRALIFPYARLIELECSSHPQYGKYEWLFEEAVLRLSLEFGDEAIAKLRPLLHIEAEGFMDRARSTIELLQNTTTRRVK